MKVESDGKGGHRVRIRVGPVNDRFAIPIADPVRAEARGRRLRALVKRIVDAGQVERGRKLLEAAEKAVDDSAFEQIERMAPLRVSGKLPVQAPAALTFRRVAEEWTSG